MFGLIMFLNFPFLVLAFADSWLFRSHLWPLTDVEQERRLKPVTGPQ